MSLTKSKIIPEDNIPIGKDENGLTISWSPKKDNDSARQLITDNCIPIPYLSKKSKQRSAVFISGVSGSGKSTIAKQLIDGYKSILPKLTDKDGNKKKYRIIFFTQSADLDHAFEEVAKKRDGTIRDEFIHVVIGKDPYYGSLTPELLKNSIIIFDDYENVDKATFAFTITLIKDLLERGRKLNIQLILINHQTQNYSKTRPIIFECDSFILFPNSNPNSVKKFLLSYLDIDKKEVDELINQAMNQFDFLFIHKSVPRYVMSRNKIQLL